MDTSIVHIGLGAFLKAHFAVYVDDYNKISKDVHLIEAISLRSNNSKKIMSKQDNLYTAHEESGKSSSYSLIKSVKKSLFLTKNRKYINDLALSENIKLITLTITEKGYCYSPSLNGLNVNNPEIIHDLKNLKECKTAIALIFSILKNRKEANIGGLIVLSCDNLPSNGNILRKVILNFASLINKELEIWISKNCAFPSSMVDRIVPKVTEKTLSKIHDKLKIQDNAAVLSEDFKQFIIEDWFIDGSKLKLDKVGVIFVKNIKPYESMKLRILNGTHSALSYIGLLLNKETISEAINDTELEKFILNMVTNHSRKPQKEF